MDPASDFEYNSEKSFPRPSQRKFFVRKNTINDYHRNYHKFTGDQLALFRERWEELEALTHILNSFSGTRNPLSTKPKLIFNWKMSNFNTRDTPQIFIQIQLLKEQEVFEVPARCGPSFMSRMFLINKSCGRVHPVFHLQDLNK